MKYLRVDDLVLAQGGLYERVLGFLHVDGLNTATKFLSVMHADGQFRLSANHVVFVEGGDKVAADLETGDKLFVLGTSGVVSKEVVVKITEEVGLDGMFAPLTSSGTIVVDNVVASNYASYSEHVALPHSAIHAAFFPVRVFHLLGLSSFLHSDGKTISSETMHPYAAFLASFA